MEGVVVVVVVVVVALAVTHRSLVLRAVQTLYYVSHVIYHVERY